MKYTVKAGDTLWGISNQYGVNVSDLASLNNVTADTLKVGMILTIPSVSGSNPDNMFMYTVSRGDTLYGIASSFGLNVIDLINLNNLGSTNLFIGQELLIPQK